MAQYVFELKGEVVIPGNDRMYTFKLYHESSQLEASVAVINRYIHRTLRAKNLDVQYIGTRRISYRRGSDVRVVRR